MRDPESVTETVEILDLGDRLEMVIDGVARRATRVLGERAGAPLAARVSTDDLDRLARLDEERRAREERFAVVDRMREAFKGVAPEEIERETARAIVEVGAEAADAAKREATAAGA
jgi:hypothetical protein